MPRRVARKPQPLSMRLPAEDVAVLDRAARLRGRSRTDFMREAAVRAAEEALMDAALVRLTPTAFAAFAAALAAPARPEPEMVALLRRQAPWEPARAPGLAHGRDAFRA